LYHELPFYFTRFFRFCHPIQSAFFGNFRLTFKKHIGLLQMSLPRFRKRTTIVTLSDSIKHWGHSTEDISQSIDLYFCPFCIAVMLKIVGALVVNNREILLMVQKS